MLKKLEVGKQYKCRNGVTLQVIRIDQAKVSYPVIMSDETTRTLNGRFYNDYLKTSPQDLVGIINENSSCYKQYKLLLKEIKINDCNDITEIIENDNDISGDLSNFEIKEIKSLNSLLENDSNKFKYKILYTVKVEK